MDKFTELNKDFMYESLQDQLKDKLGDRYTSLKRGILTILDLTIGKDNTELVEVQNLIHGYVEDPEKSTLTGFVDDSEIFDFYLKYQGNIDEACNDNEYFSKVPTEGNIFSLYKYVIEGTKFAVQEVMKAMEKELF